MNRTEFRTLHCNLRVDGRRVAGVTKSYGFLAVNLTSGIAFAANSDAHLRGLITGFLCDPKFKSTAEIRRLLLRLCATNRHAVPLP